MKKTPPISERLCRNLRDGAAAKGLNQREIARKTGLHFVSINRIFKGRQQPPLETIEILAHVCGVPLEKIFR